MTVSYQYDVACSTSGGFTRLLFKWKGSVYKLVYRELIWFSIAYATVSIVYRCVLTETQKRYFEGLVGYCNTFINAIPLPFVLGFYVSFVASRWWQQFVAIPWPDKVFEHVVNYCNTFINLIPLTFVLGFYVTFVASRWWQQYVAIPWPDKILHCIALYVAGTDDNSRMVRRTLMRYLNLSLILVLRSISMAVKKRFPTLQHVVEAGFMTKIELDLYQAVPSVEFNTYWIPCTWFINLLKDARKTNLINDSQGLKLIMEEFNEYRARCGLLWSYDWVSIPLVYTQVVTLATYSFFIACIVGRQYIEAGDPSIAKTKVDLYIPIFTLLQFFFYMGLLKVAEALINPFGDDDEDFELNWIIDRHTKVSFLVVDSLINKNPPLVKDAYFDDQSPILAYTKAAMAYKKKTYRGSVAYVSVPEDQQTLVLPDIPEEEENSDFVAEVPPRRSASAFINLLNPEKNWTGSHHKSRGRRGAMGNLSASQELGRLSTTSLPDEALKGFQTHHGTGTPLTRLQPETMTAPAALGRRNFQTMNPPGTRGFNHSNHHQPPTYSSESLAPSEISESGPEGSPEISNRNRITTQPCPVVRTPSNLSTMSEEDNGHEGLVRSKWKMVRKRFMRNKSHSIDVENPATLMSHSSITECSLSTPDVKVENETQTACQSKKGSGCKKGKCKGTDGDKDKKANRDKGPIANKVPQTATHGKCQQTQSTKAPAPAPPDSNESGSDSDNPGLHRSTSSTKSKKRRSGRSRRTPPRLPHQQNSSDSQRTDNDRSQSPMPLDLGDGGCDSGVPSPEASMTDLHHDYGHPIYNASPRPVTTKKPPDPPRGPPARTCSLLPEIFLSAEGSSSQAEVAETTSQNNVLKGTRANHAGYSNTSRSMPNLRANGTGGKEPVPGRIVPVEVSDVELDTEEHSSSDSSDKFESPSSTDSRIHSIHPQTPTPSRVGQGTQTQERLGDVTRSHLLPYDTGSRDSVHV